MHTFLKPTLIMFMNELIMQEILKHTRKYDIRNIRCGCMFRELDCRIIFQTQKKAFRLWQRKFSFGYSGNFQKFSFFVSTIRHAALKSPLNKNWRFKRPTADSRQCNMSNSLVLNINSWMRPVEHRDFYYRAVSKVQSNMAVRGPLIV